MSVHYLESEGFERAVCNYTSAVEQFRYSVDSLNESIRLFVRVSGMIATNQIAAQRGEPPVYGENDFV